MTHHWKALLLLESAKKIFAKSSYKEKMFAKKWPKNDKLFIFLKALDHAISNMQKVLQNFN